MNTRLGRRIVMNDRLLKKKERSLRKNHEARLEKGHTKYIYYHERSVAEKKIRMNDRLGNKHENPSCMTNFPETYGRWLRQQSSNPVWKTTEQLFTMNDRLLKTKQNS